MNVREIPRTTVETYLKLVRLPIDALIERLPGDETGVASTAQLVVDRTDASVRGALASILRDAGLREDAKQRAIAAKKRQRAMRLREQAERTTTDADDRLDELTAKAEGQRQRVKKEAQGRREQAESQRKEKAKRAADAERERLEVSRKASARAEQAVEKRATRERLRTLDTKTESLREREQALTAADEARRLGDAAARVKAERKNGNQ